MESRGSKRKRSSDDKNTLVLEIYALNNDSFKLTEDLNTETEDFSQIFKTVGERQSEMYARSVALDEQYEHILGLLKGDIAGHSGETSNTPRTFPSSYASDTPKFFSDASLSLDDHSKGFLKKVDEMIKEADEQTTIWKGKLTEMKRQAEHLVSQRTKLAAELSDFTKQN